MSLKVKNGVSLVSAYQAVLSISDALTMPNEKMHKIVWFLHSHLNDAVYDYNDLGSDVDHVTLINVGYKTEMIHRINLSETDDCDISYDTNQILNYFPLLSLIEKRAGSRVVEGIVTGVLATRFQTSEDLRRKVCKHIVDFCDLTGESLQLAQRLCD